MKTTIHIPDSLFEEAKELASKEHTTLKAIIEEGLRKVLTEKRKAEKFKLRKGSFKGRGLQHQFRSASWEQIRDEVYGGHGS